MITLAQSREGRADKVVQKIIDTFIRESEVLELLPFDNAVSPNGGSTLVYGYVQTKLPSQAAYRAINTEYTPNEATVEKQTVELAIFGGAFEIDRVIKDIEGQLNNMAFQLEQKIKAAVALFHNGMINGDTAVDANGFDGLDKMLTGTTSEYNTDGQIDISTKAMLEANASDLYEQLVMLINRTGAHALIMNELAKSKIQTIARVLGYKTESEEAFGRVVTTIGEGKVRLIDLKNIATVSGDAAVETPIVPIAENGTTSIYAVKFDVNDGFHGVTLTGNDVINTYLPDFKAPNAVKKGEVEMVACVALKNTKSAGVLRNIKVS